MGVWYPSVVCDLQLRFDEAFNVQEDKSPAATTIQGAESQTNIFGSPKVQPLISYGAADQLTQLGAVVPKSGSIELNGYRQAHTFTLTFDWKDIPIDPRLIRDTRIGIYVGLVSPEDFSTGMTRIGLDGRRRSMLDISSKKANLMFYGLVDEASVEHTQAGSWVTVQGRDLRGVLIDRKVDPRLIRDINLATGIDDVVKQIIGKLPFSKDFKVTIQPQEWPNGVPSPATNQTVDRHRLGADGKQKPLLSPQMDSNVVTYWDLVTKYCNLVGAVPFFVGTEMRIRQMRSLYQQQVFDPNHPTPFSGGKPRSLKLGNKTESTTIRRFVYGRDIANVKFSRKYRGQKVPLIECWSVQTSSPKRGLGRLLIERWPQAKGSQKAVANALKTSVSPSGQVAQTEPVRFFLPGVTDTTVLLTIAQNLYQEIGRNEMGGSALTSDFSSFNTDDDADPDMISLMPGDAVQFAVDRRKLTAKSPLVAPIIEDQRKSFTQAVADTEKVLGRGDPRQGDHNLARVLVATGRNSVVELPDVFRVKNVKYTLKDGGAIALEFDFENYIEVRADKVNPAVAKTTQPVRSKAVKT